MPWCHGPTYHMGFNYTKTNFLQRSSCSMTEGVILYSVVDEVLLIKPTRCFNSQIYFWNKNTCFGHFLCPSSAVFHCTHSNGIRVCHTGLLTACEQDQDGTTSVLILLASCQQTCITYTIARVYSEKLLMMDRGTVRNM